MKTFNWKLLIFWLAGATAAALWGSYIGSQTVDVFKVSRGPIFAGMLALAGLLFTSKINWLNKLKEAYESEEHIENVNELREKSPSTQYYGGYNRIASALYLTTVIVLLTAFAQITVGFIEIPVIAGACLGAAGTVVIIFLNLSFRIHRIEKAWIKKIERDQNLKQNSHGGNAKLPITAR